MGWWDDVLAWRASKKTLVDVLEELEEKDMAKKRIVEFKKRDGMTPGRAEEPGRPFLLKMPVNVSVTSQGMQAVKLGLSCNLPVLVTRGPDTRIFAPGQELEVVIEGPGRRSNSDESIVLGIGETVARCYVLDCEDMELSE